MPYTIWLCFDSPQHAADHYRMDSGSGMLAQMLSSRTDSDACLRQPRKARPAIFAPPNGPVDASGVRSTDSAAP